MRTIFENYVNRLFLIIGNVNDKFMTADLQNHSFQVYLNRHLKSLGYERVVFYSGTHMHGKYVLDDESAYLSFTKNKGENDQGISSELKSNFTNHSMGEQSACLIDNLGSGQTDTGYKVSSARRRPGSKNKIIHSDQKDTSLDGSNNIINSGAQDASYTDSNQLTNGVMQNITTKKNSNLIYSQPKMQELTFLTECKRFLTDNNHKTAVVFTYFQDFVNNSTGLREYFSFFKEAFTSYRSYQNNQNICIFIARTEENDVIQELFERNTELKDAFLKSCTTEKSGQGTPWVFDNKKVWNIGLPDNIEIGYLLEYLRIVGNEYVSGNAKLQNQKLSFKSYEKDDLVSDILYFSRQEKEDLLHIQERIIRFMDRSDKDTVHLSKKDVCHLYGQKFKEDEPAIQQLNKKGWEPVYQKISTIAKDYEIKRMEYEEKAAKVKDNTIIGDSNIYDSNTVHNCICISNIKESIMKEYPVTLGGRLDIICKDTFRYSIPHFVLLGNPGVGKTTCANLMGKVLREIGILKSGHVVAVSRDSLVAGYVGQTAIKTRKCIEQAKDGVLFIDEAYSLIKSNHDKSNDNDFGKECIDTLVNAMTDGVTPFCLIMAGYPDDMDRIFEANVGLMRRVKRDNVITIPNYSPDLLRTIFMEKVSEEGYKTEEDVNECLETYFENLTNRYSKKEFGNADEAVKAADIAIAGSRNRNDKSKSIIQSDFGDTMELFMDRSKNSVENIMKKLNQFIGLHNIKDLFWDMEYSRRDCEERGKDYIASVKHMVFAGNPGVGKTSVAEMMGELLYGMGAISNPNIIKVDASTLMGNAYHSAAENINKVIEEAVDKGTLLFIDEAHQFIDTPYAGKNVIDAMMKPMADMNKYSSFKVIFAVYESRLKEFYSLNDGLKSRIQEIVFPDYTPAELMQIFEKMTTDDDISITPDAKQMLYEYFEHLYKNKTEQFGNAREVNIVKSALETVRIRRVHQDNDMNNRLTFTIEDVRNIM